MTAKDRDRLMEIIKAAGTERMLDELTAKTHSVHIRISATDKANMEAMANACELTLTEYIVRLHKVAQAGLVKLTKARKAAARSGGAKEGSRKGQGKP